MESIYSWLESHSTTIKVVIGIVVYLTINRGIAEIAFYLWGQKGAKWEIRTIGFPVWVLIGVLNTLINIPDLVKDWAKMQHDKTLFIETFGVNPKRKEAAQEAVRETLKRRAISLQYYIDNDNGGVPKAKDQYWTTHGLAERWGMSVPKRWEQSL